MVLYKCIIIIIKTSAQILISLKISVTEKQVTLNNALDYRTNGRYRTPTLTLTLTLVCQSISPIASVSPLVHLI